MQGWPAEDFFFSIFQDVMDAVGNEANFQSLVRFEMQVYQKLAALTYAVAKVTRPDPAAPVPEGEQKPGHVN
jgi:hypothetical protein